MPKILRPNSPHLPIYKPQLTSTFPISHRISGAFLATIVFFFYLLCLKIGLICFTYENVYQFFFFSSKLILISVGIIAFFSFYHISNGIRHLYLVFSSSTYSIFMPFFIFIIIGILLFYENEVVSYCEGLHAFSSPKTPQEAGTPPQEDPVPEPMPPEIPQLDPPLVSDEDRRQILYRRFLFLNLGGDTNLHRMISIIDLQLIVERSIEAALVDDGIHPTDIIPRYANIRGIIHSPQGSLLSERTYGSYVNQIREQGTRQSVPYQRIRRAILSYDLVFPRQ
ncbi:uncharacterized protein LOC127240799 [Andrographis paniculata]|uniref:uncharacterized protein LOC127240799 n=1 Tax=Andrographis paniculata TaxID=175694 RepID=UPI0021E8B121|nr:uncharacterized protein LOC127240799 [Andrographis paniculata]